MTARLPGQTILIVAARAFDERVRSEQKPRVGRWKIRSEAPPPSSNIMSYEPFGAKGMKVTYERIK